MENDFNDFSLICQELDSRITQDEVFASIKQLKMGKAHGDDSILNEYFLESADIILTHINL